MRYGADHKEKTRQRILDAAAVVFRRQGFQAGSVDDVMSEAGLTAGGFYAHFESKDDLFAAALVDTLRQARIVYGKDDEQLEGAERIGSIAAKYLSPVHRKQIERGCAMPPLLADLPRQSPATRRAFEKMLAQAVESLTPHLTGTLAAPPADQALALLAMFVGGMTLSRAVDDESLGNRILAACRQWVDVSLQHAAANSIVNKDKGTKQTVKKSKPAESKTARSKASTSRPQRKPRS